MNPLGSHGNAGTAILDGDPLNLVHWSVQEGNSTERAFRTTEDGVRRWMITLAIDAKRLGSVSNETLSQWAMLPRGQTVIFTKAGLYATTGEKAPVWVFDQLFVVMGPQHSGGKNPMIHVVCAGAASVAPPDAGQKEARHD
ncbi:MAG: hypothetical protein ABSD28_15655 [Tepidisphaeraceae bacterium]|jgi:hypothetical protein